MHARLCEVKQDTAKFLLKKLSDAKKIIRGLNS